MITPKEKDPWVAGIEIQFSTMEQNMSVVMSSLQKLLACGKSESAHSSQRAIRQKSPLSLGNDNQQSKRDRLASNGVVQGRGGSYP